MEPATCTGPAAGYMEPAAGRAVSADGGAAGRTVSADGRAAGRTVHAARRTVRAARRVVAASGGARAVPTGGIAVVAVVVRASAPTPAIVDARTTVPDVVRGAVVTIVR